MFNLMQQAQLSELHFKSTPNAQLNAIVAIHSNRRGTALGGCRLLPYKSDTDAIQDAINLARSMSYKAALAELPQGGGKAVIIEPQQPYDRQRLLLAFADFINELGGRYITAVDSGTYSKDMDTIASRSQYTTSTSAIGNPSPYTAQGVLIGIQAAVASQLRHDSLKGVHIAVQGLGQVGMSLAKAAYAQGARLTVTDTNPAQIKAAQTLLDCDAVAPSDIFTLPCDVLAPCALGGCINEQTLPQLQCSIIAGSANNPLSSSALAQKLHLRNILFAPDYAINAGGLIFVSMRHYQHAELSDIDHKIQRIGTTLQEIFLQAHHQRSDTLSVCKRLAEAKLYLHSPHPAQYTQQALTSTQQPSLNQESRHAPHH